MIRRGLICDGTNQGARYSRQRWLIDEVGPFNPTRDAKGNMPRAAIVQRMPAVQATCVPVAVQEGYYRYHSGQRIGPGAADRAQEGEAKANCRAPHEVATNAVCGHGLVRHAASI